MSWIHVFSQNLKIVKLHKIINLLILITHLLYFSIFDSWSNQWRTSATSTTTTSRRWCSRWSSKLCRKCSGTSFHGWSKIHQSPIHWRGRIWNGGVSFDFLDLKFCEIYFMEKFYHASWKFYILDWISPQFINFTKFFVMIAPFLKAISSSKFTKR